MTKDNIELSRRKVLAGLGAVGVAGAGAGLGTSALFSDEESFDGNVITAGELDLIVGYYSYWDQGRAGTGSVGGDVNGGTVSGELTDVKPGDSGLLAFCPRIVDNPAYLWLCGELTANDENGYTEPEPDTAEGGDANDPGDPDGAGELADAIEVTLGYCELGEVGDDGFDPGDVESATEIGSGSFAELMTVLSNGLPLDGTGDPGEIGFLPPGERACFPGSEAGADDGNVCLCLEWEVPTEVGNEIQTDSIEFDLSFHAQQCRHNDGTDNPCCADASLDLATGTGSWTVTSVPDGAPEPESPPVAVTDPIGPWVGATECAEWVNPYDGNTNDSDPAGEYEYQAEFELPADAEACELTVESFAADNSVTFALDGNPFGGYASSDGYDELHGPLETTVSGGAHTLTATVENGAGNSGNPTGLLACVSVECTCGPLAAPGPE